MPNSYETLSHPSRGATVTPSNSDLLPNAGVLYVGEGGDITVLTSGGDEITLVAVPTGSFVPVMVAKVFDTGTTADNMVVLY